MFIITIINIIVITIISFIFKSIYKKAEYYGKKEISYKLTTRRTYGLESAFKEKIYFLHGNYEGKKVKLVITKDEYDILANKSEKVTYVYVRKFLNKWLSPNFEEYEISLSDIDWNKKDRASIIKGAIFLAITFESLALCFYYMI